MGTILRVALNAILAVAALAGGLVFAAPVSAVAAAPVAVAAGPGAVGGLSARTLAAGLQDFTFESMAVDYTLSRADDGTSRLLVEETFVAVFPESDQNHGMQRAIPDSYGGAPLFPSLVSVTDGEGRERPAETDTDDGYFVVTSADEDFVHGEQTYVFTYELQNVVRPFADTGADEFYWDVNGLQWAQPFGSVSVALHLDPVIADALTGSVACYAGSEGSVQTCAIEVGERGGEAAVTARTTELGPQQTMTIAVGFAAGTFREFDSSYFAAVEGWWQAAALLAVAGAVVAAALVRTRPLRDAPGRPTVVAEFTPPRIVDALESAVLLGQSTKAIPAEVLEQAVAGSIRIVEGARRWSGSVRLQAELVDPTRADGDGRMLLEGLFGAGAPAGAVFEFGRDDTRFSTAARSILSAAGKELQQRGLRRPVPPSVRAWPVAAAVVAAALVVVAGIAAIYAGVVAWVPVVLMVVAVVGVFVVGALVSHRPLTALGAETRDHLAGLKVFIEWAEADRIRMLQSPAGAERTPVDTGDPRSMLRLYEVLLPYAVVFGQEKQWAEHLAVLYDTTGSPGWYGGSAAFNAAAFSAGIGSLSASAAAASSSGGSTGGGSAGGGGGGGGGGGV